MVAYIVIPELYNSAHRCGQHSWATVSLRAMWPHNIMTFSKTCVLLGVHCVSQCDVASQHQAAGTVDKAREMAHRNCMYALINYSVPGSRIKHCSSH